MRHRFHALCPYFAMFPESFAQKWIERLTDPGDCILDPFCGRGTAPFQALLLSRKAVATDINPVAYCVTKAKTNAPNVSVLRRRLTLLEQQFQPEDWERERRDLPEFFHVAYSPSTLRQILYMRDNLNWRESDTDSMLAALMLGSLHGENSPTYLSNQMPRTISTKPVYSIKFWRDRDLFPLSRNTFDILRRQIAYRYESVPPRNKALVFEMDMRDLPRKRHLLPKKIRCAVTSPPYLDVTSFEEDQWLRLWFLGGASHPTYKKLSKDDRHANPANYWKMIADMWRSLSLTLAPKSDVVIRLGGKRTTPEQLIDGLIGASAICNRRVRLVSHEISRIKNRQTDAFRPGSIGCRLEVDCHFKMA